MAEPAGARLSRRLRRILVMLPYIIANPGVTIDELTERFSVKRRDVLADLELVYFCGLPGYTPGDLIDVALDGDTVSVGMADYFSAPLRLTPAEALTMYASGAAVASLPGMEGADALSSALAKLERALGARHEGPAGIEVQMEAGSTPHLEVLGEALGKGVQVRLEYLSASRGELTDRIVEPWGLIAALGRWYLVGLDHLSGEERMFRTDRIKDVSLLDEPAEIPPDFDPGSYRGAFRGEGESTFTFEISPSVASWFRDYYPLVSDVELPDGWHRIELLAGGLRWAATLLVRLGAGARAISSPEVESGARSLAKGIAARYG